MVGRGYTDWGGRGKSSGGTVCLQPRPESRSGAGDRLGLRRKSLMVSHGGAHSNRTMQVKLMESKLGTSGANPAVVTKATNPYPCTGLRQASNCSS